MGQQRVVQHRVELADEAGPATFDAAVKRRCAAVGDEEDGAPALRCLGDRVQVGVEQVVEVGGEVGAARPGDGIGDLGEGALFFAVE